jgi:hypothetical protein
MTLRNILHVRDIKAA